MTKNQNINLGWISLIVVLLFVYYLFGFVGVRTILGIVALFFIPAYAVLSNFDLEMDEKIFFSFFIGLGVFPLVVAGLDRIVHSLRASMLISVLLLILIGIILRKYRKK